MGATMPEILEGLPTLEEIAGNPALRERGLVAWIAEKHNMARPNVATCLYRLVKKGAAHIIAYTETKPRAPIFVKGEGLSVDRPPPPTEEEKQIRYERHLQAGRDRRRLEREAREAQRTAIPEKREPSKSMLKTEASIERARRQPATWISALEW